MHAHWWIRCGPAESAPVYLIDSVLETRTEGGRAQSKVHWHGYSSRWDTWLNDAILVRGGAEESEVASFAAQKHVSSAKTPKRLRGTD